MNELIKAWLTEQGVQQVYLDSAAIAIGVAVILVISSISFYVAKYHILKVIQRVIVHSKNKWDDALIEHNVLNRVTLLIPFILMLFLAPIILPDDSLSQPVMILVAKVILTFQIARSISALLNAGRSGYQETAKQRYLPLNAIIQMIKLALYIVASIIIVALIIDRSPVYLLSGLGALTAVLLLVFQDTIKGLVASIQISANRMVVTGDWVELPKYGADGDVIEIGLSTVKIENFDKTITTVPTYALISDSFRNWRNMYHTGARRIKRSIIIDLGSIDFFSADKIQQLSNASLLNNYLNDKKQQLASQSKQDNDDESLVKINHRQLTNIGTFRAYITEYLQRNQQVRSNLTCMVRQLPATENGLPLEIYCFADTTDWLTYEAIQADIFDHLFAVASQFELRVFQHPSGHDWQRKS
ncbi:mechanosensitive ion channel [Colwellia asteriadis]|uniref:Mechanosensitive ion channel n=1 Tax=Colwellia asteriadis TaxID=517723 RepID=A0ABN1L4C6_9GAMM